jgi:phytoene/squalene synthetase
MSLVRPARVTEGRLYDTVADRSAAVVIHGYSTSFGLASRLLTEPVRTHVRNLYALVRIADEIVDTPDRAFSTHDRAALLDGLQEEAVRAMASGRSSNLVVHAFATTARATGIGPDLVDPFFGSMRTDLQVQAHDTSSLERYVYGSAEVVGLMCLRIFLACEDRAGEYDDLADGARRLGAAFQKINFLRDLAEDQGVLGRRYFPGLSAESFSDLHRDAILDDIAGDLRVARAAIPRLPRSSRRAVRAAQLLFEELAVRLQATPAARIAMERVSVPGPVKARLLARALVGVR